jgi:hypothetical protein
MNRVICIVLEFNCYEPVRKDDDSPASLWLVPYSLAGDEHDFDHHKPTATCIIGPVATRVAEQVGDSLSTALGALGFTIERESTADD